MLMPKRTKYRKSHRLTYDGKAKGNLELHFGDYGLKAMEGGWISARQIEAARIAMTRYMKRGGKVFINIFPHMPRTKKPLETRQGKGKGAVDEWVAVVKKGKIMFEIKGVSEEVAREALRLASHKLSVKTKFVKKEEVKDGDSLGN
jgi:large subunit ribosomal protein L16